ncbi:MAG: ATP-binding cassette domain-containing protein [Xanthomonadaceae bacterium]|nr:ATP-binding cassette domain-containing protein [Rhodospirillaceae bacterium]NIA18232.1 ATP-binding cassette domain-containing protein [Xanthomonadaceae bacterium]
MLLEVKNLSVNLDGENIINNISFQVAQGEILTIMGPNGSGKSVLLRTLLGFLPYKGKIIWQDRPKIGYLPQGLTQLRVKDFPLTIQDFFALKNPSPTREKIIQFLNLVGLDKNILAKDAGRLSGGQFQRMLVSWVLISHPQIIFFDEPTTGIDIGGGENIYSLLRAIQEKEKITIFLVTHDLNIVYKYSSKVLCLSHKEYNCYGSPKEILDPKILKKVFGMEIKFYDHHQH